MKTIIKKVQKLIYFLIALSLTYSLPVSAWYDTNSAGTSPDWAFRVPIEIPSSATQNSTIKVDVDFADLLSTLGISGTFDVQSPRIVRSDDSTLANIQEFTDSLYNSASDSTGNEKGEIKFIYEDNGANTYYLYFDITENGTKPANPKAPINGNFEHSTDGSTPIEWTIDTAPAGVSNQNNEAHETVAGATYSNNAVTCSDQAISNADDSPNTGGFWHLIGYRDQCETGNLSEQIMLKKTLTVPSSEEGDLTFYFQLQAFDDINYDYVRLRINDVVIDPTTLGIVNSNLTISNTKIGRASNYSSGLVDAGWTKATLDLGSYAGSNITIELGAIFASDNAYRTWVKIDDVEWSIKTATLGTPEKQSPSISLKKTSAIISDPLNSTNPKRIPGSIIEYTITATNSGLGKADNNTVIIIDPIPTNTKFIVDSIQFIAADTIDSGLTADSSNYTYSSDGGSTYNSSQSTAITHFKVSPQGEFLAPSGSGNPTFSVKYRVTVD